MARRHRFPPYELLDQDYLAETQAKHRKLETIYHAAQDRAWDGREVLTELLERHGGIQLDPEKRAAIARIFSVILWGELAAWNVAADLALSIQGIEAKMAATSQAFDEARHFYVMRDYLLELGIEVPPLDSFTRAVLIELAETPSLPRKLLGMQLLVENVALHLFKMVGEAGVEPVLSDLLPYIERDEARHVGLGVQYLPAALDALRGSELVALQLFHLKLNVLVFWAAVGRKPDFLLLGMDPNPWFVEGMKKQSMAIEMIEQQMGRAFTWTREGDGAGVGLTARFWRTFNQASIDTFFPPYGTEIEPYHALGLRTVSWVARKAQQFLELAA